MNVSLTGLESFVTLQEIAYWREKSQAALETLLDGSGRGGEMTGWLNPSTADAEISEQYAARLRERSDVVLVCGIGGSYLGAKAVAEMLELEPGRLEFVGNTLSGGYNSRILRSLEGRDFSIVVISKSGTTTEPAVGFRIFEELLRSRYGTDAAKRVVAVTNPGKGALRAICESRGYPMLTIPDDVGGRYSVFTPAGLLPLAAAGASVTALIRGARRSREQNLENAVTYATARRALYASGKQLEVLSVWEPSLRWLGEWYKQLFGESEGKDGIGIFPVSLEMTADLHSMGQYMQDGVRNMFETFLWTQSTAAIAVPATADDFDGFNRIAGLRLDALNRMAFDATMAAHIEGGVPAIKLEIDAMTAETVGEFLMFLMLSCGISGYASGVNPFDQPGVENYKSKLRQLM
ncbi:MAG: glucose-6-phosphate isomerase [Oscillospiraceae bacterium]|jgi:glucose-6-phosphate isomerase|nr:glucose-6-phosphate isomerase [Oscillospiraceae bacterium]